MNEEKQEEIPFSELRKQWMKNPKFCAEYDALEGEFSLSDAIFRARTAAELTQAQLAELMHMTPSNIARLESGRVKPSTRTLERLAAATGLRLRISFEAPSARL